MRTSTQKGVVGYLEWHAEEEEHDAELLEECARRFGAVRGPFLPLFRAPISCLQGRHAGATKALA